LSTADTTSPWGSLLLARIDHYATPAAEQDVRELAALAESRPEGLADWLGSTSRAAELAQVLLRNVQRRHQFSVLDAKLQGRLEGIFAHSLSALAEMLAAPSSEPAGERLAALLAAEEREVLSLLGELPPAEKAVVCAEYSLELQLQVLGVSLQDVREPILDLGCGERAELVTRWRAEGRAAVGLDRHGHGPGIIQADWLVHPFPPGVFGTILSHQAFSLHFLHHHLAAGDQAAAYARKYMELLRALLPGGSFIYAPGLPFVEQHLPAATWRLERVSLPAPLQTAVDSVFRSRVGADVAYACRVTRNSE
jgi:hypothetical protein